MSPEQNKIASNKMYQIINKSGNKIVSNELRQSISSSGKHEIVSGKYELRTKSDNTQLENPSREQHNYTEGENEIDKQEIGTTQQSHRIDWSTINTQNHDRIEIAWQVIESGKHNSDQQGLKIEINRNWNIEVMEKLLEQYHDKQILTHLKFGWPANRDISAPEPQLSDINHKGANQFRPEIDQYIWKELANQRMAGPYENIPFSKRIGVSPMNSRPKRESSERRIIIDFSWPIDHSVNDGINKDVYMGKDVELRFPTIDTLARRVVELGIGCAVFKKDLKSAFRQLDGDPFDYSLMLYMWENRYFVDLAVAMGMRSAPSCCQHVTDAIRYIHNQAGHWLMNYIDDFIGAERWNRVWHSYHELGELLKLIGAKEAPEKASMPDTQVNCLGTLFDTIAMTISVIPERLLELRTLLNSWSVKICASRKEVEQLIGKIQFVANCVRQGRVFVARLLNWLRALPKNGREKIPYEARKDIFWWYVYFPQYNGVSLMWYTNVAQIDGCIATDASLSACGGMCGDEYFRHCFPDSIRDMVNNNISHLEMFTIIVAIKKWKTKLKGKRFIVSCDNEACVILLNHGRARDRILQQCLREIAFLAATYQFLIKSRHVMGIRNKIPDMLSRWYISRDSRRQFRRLKDRPTKRVYIEDSDYKFLNDW